MAPSAIAGMFCSLSPGAIGCRRAHRSVSRTKPTPNLTGSLGGKLLRCRREGYCGESPDVVAVLLLRPQMLLIAAIYTVWRALPLLDQSLKQPRVLPNHLCPGPVGNRVAYQYCHYLTARVQCYARPVRYQSQEPPQSPSRMVWSSHPALKLKSPNPQHAPTPNNLHHLWSTSFSTTHCTSSSQKVLIQGRPWT